MVQESYTDITFHIEQGIARIAINRPEKMNAMRITTYRELISAMQRADKSEECKLILLESQGDVFCAGNDLSDLLEGDPGEVMECVQGIFSTVAELKKVLVAAVEGVAVGIGTTILLYCDMVVASKSSRFRLPFVNLGVCPEGGASLLLPQAIGQKAAREVLLTGRFFSAREAFNWGLITSLSETGLTSSAAMRHIALLLQQPLDSLLATKSLLKSSLADVDKVVATELTLFSELLKDDKTQKRIRALARR